MKPIVKMLKAGVFYSAILALSTCINAHELQFEEPYAACEASSGSDLCSFTNGAGDLHRGTCQNFGETLMCVRNQPIVYAAKLDTSASQHHQSKEHDHSHD